MTSNKEVANKVGRGRGCVCGEEGKVAFTAKLIIFH